MGGSVWMGGLLRMGGPGRMGGLGRMAGPGRMGHPVQVGAPRPIRRCVRIRGACGDQEQEEGGGLYGEARTVAHTSLSSSSGVRSSTPPRSSTAAAKPSRSSSFLDQSVPAGRSRASTAASRSVTLSPT